MSKFVTEDFLLNLSSGSYETLIEKVETFCKELFPEDNVKVLATFPRHVIIIKNDNNIYRIGFKNTNNKIEVLETEEIDISKYVINENTIKELSGSIIDDILNDNNAIDKISNLAFVLSLSEDRANNDFMMAVKDIFNQDRFWKKFIDNAVQSYKENHRDIKLDTFSDRKYEKLYIGKVSEKDFHLYTESIIDDLTKIIEEFNNIKQNIMLLSDGGFAKEVNNFFNDVVEDMNLIQDKISILIEENNHCPLCMGFLCDEFTENISRYRTANAFLNKIVNLGG